MINRARILLIAVSVAGAFAQDQQQQPQEQVQQQNNVQQQPSERELGWLGEKIEEKMNNSNIQLCEGDCDDDSQCATGLLCTKNHRAELFQNGFINVGAANCGWDGNPLRDVCFDPAIIGQIGESESSVLSAGAGGDPHFRMYDGTAYSFHGQCDLVMARSPMFADSLGLDLHARTQIVNGWSLISNAALRIGEDVLELVNDGTHYLNGVKNYEMPLTMAGKFTVTQNDEHVTKTHEDGSVTTETSVVLVIDLGENNEKISLSLFRHMISVRVDANLPGTGGMLGIPGRKGKIGRDGIVLTSADEMGNQWQVNDVEPMIFHEERAPQYPDACVMPAVTSRRLRESNGARRAAEAACSKVSEIMFPFCVEDVLMTGDASIAEGAYYF